MQKREFGWLKLPGLGLLLAFSLSTGYAQVGGGFDLSWASILGGGATSSTGGTYALGASIGQPYSGTPSGGTYSVQSGLWAGAGPACTLSPDYQATVTSGATIVPGTSRVPGSICNSCTVSVALPFSYSFYGTPYTQVNISNKGVVQFASNSSDGNNVCLPSTAFNDAIFAYWDEHNTNINDTMGIFTSVSGTAPNRIFNIEWRAGYVANDVRSRFQLRLYEGEPKFDVIYANTRRGFSATVGVQKGTGERYTQYVCNTNNGVPNGTRLTFDQRVCPGALPTRP